MWSVWGRREMHTGFLVEKPEGKNHLIDLGIDGKMILKYILKKKDGIGVRWHGVDEFMWIRVGESSRFLWTPKCRFRFCEKRGIS
jgi:hypothetical protein